MAKSADKVAAKAARKAKKASQPKVSPIKSLQIYLQNNTGKKLALYYILYYLIWHSYLSILSLR